jgi:NADPH:quinone reductase-like Zn-dependent oxidoreductase
MFSYVSLLKFVWLATSGNTRPGGFAEFAILEADLAIHIPNVVSFEQAATVPLCSLTAAQVRLLIILYPQFNNLP